MENQNNISKAGEEKPAPPTERQLIEVANKVFTILEPFPVEARRRIMRSVAAFFGLDTQRPASAPRQQQQQNRNR